MSLLPGGMLTLCDIWQVSSRRGGALFTLEKFFCSEKFSLKFCLTFEIKISSEKGA